MSIFIGPMRKHIFGNKEQTKHSELLIVDPDEVSIPLMHANAEIQILVKPGDKVKIGDMIAKRDDRLYVPIFSSVSGTVKAIEKRQATNLKPTDYCIIENDHQDERIDGFYLKEDSSKDEIVEYMKTIGLLGQGGAGFPSYIKYSTDKCESLIVNAVECEPYINSDDRNITDNLEYLKQGVKFAIKASNCKKCFICLKKYKKELINKLKDLFNDIELVTVLAVPDVYPMGWERTLVYEVLKKRYEKLPIEAGAIVSNVTSLIELARSAKEGLPIYKKYVTVAGDAVKDPHVVLCRVGTSFKQLIEICGGYTSDSIKLLAGGPMMGASVTKDEVAVTSISNCVLVLKYKVEKELSCLRCGTCVLHCPSGLQPVNIVSSFKAKDFEALAKLKAIDCVECGMCSYVCPSKIEVTEGVRRAKRAIMQRSSK